MDEVKGKLNILVELFCYVEDKDIFSSIYRAHLSKRLLEDKSTSEEIEKHMILYFREKCGPQLTCKLEGMLNDISENRDEYEKYNNAVKQIMGNKYKFDYQVKVLTKAYWPTPKEFNPYIPDSILMYIDTFSSYYQRLYPRRILNFLHYESNMQLYGSFDNEYIIQLSLPQALLLLYFNKEKELKYGEIKRMFRCDDSLCKRIISPLLYSKYKILEKNSSVKEFNDNDIIKINNKFKSPSRRIVIPMSTIENIVYKEKTFENRTLTIEAAIVRVMKSRRQLTHQKLVSLVAEQISLFKPSIEV